MGYGVVTMSQHTGCESAEDSVSLEGVQIHGDRVTSASSGCLTVKLKRLMYGMSTACSLESLEFTEFVPCAAWHLERCIIDTPLKFRVIGKK